MEKNIKFEDAISQLAEIVKSLESGEVPLDESIELYETGMRLSKQCTELLEKAEQKVKFLQQNEVDDHE